VKEHYIRFAGELVPFKLESIFKEITSFADIGGGNGYLSIKICKKFSHLRGVTVDLPHLHEVYNEYILRPEFKGLSDRVAFLSLDFLKEELPHAVDAFIFGCILHELTEDKKRALLIKAFKALKMGGRIIIFENLIDDAK
jgi:cyclopropane fatty-acyl-phospholipid synthase-like methyltransferase